MKKEIIRVLKECEKNQWITINKDLQIDALAGVFVTLLRDMKLSDYIQMFNPNNILEE